MQLPPTNRNSNGFSSDFGHLRIKEIIRTLEANSRNRKKTKLSLRWRIFHCLDPLNNPQESPIRQRPLSQPCTRTETNAILTNHRQYGTTTDDAKLLSTVTKQNGSPCLNNSHRSDISLRSITKFVTIERKRKYFRKFSFSANNTTKWNRSLKPHSLECPAVFVNVTLCWNGVEKNYFIT